MGQMHRVMCLPVYTPAFTLVPIYTAWSQRHMGVNNLLEVVTTQRRGQESNSQPLSQESNALITRLTNHPPLHKD